MPSEPYVWFREIIAGAIGSVLSSKIAGFHLPLSEDERARLFLDFQDLPADAAAVMWRRHREALNASCEHYFIRALSKIPPERRRETLIKLAEQPDEAFVQQLTFLIGVPGERGRRFTYQAETVLAHVMGLGSREESPALIDKMSRLRADAQKWMQEYTAELHRRNEERKEHRRRTTFLWRHRSTVYAILIVLGTIALALLIGFLNK